MSTWESCASTNQIEQLSIPIRRFIVSLQHFKELPDFYLDKINVYQRDENRLILLKNEMVANLKSWTVYDIASTSIFQNNPWDSLEIVIPDVESSTPLDDINEIKQALEYAVVIGGDMPKLIAPLPLHLQLLQTYLDPLLQLSPLNQLPEYFTEIVENIHNKFERQFYSCSGTIIMLTNQMIVARIYIRSQLMVNLGVLTYTVQIKPGNMQIVIPKTEKRLALLSDGSGMEWEEPLSASFAGILIWNCRGAGKKSFLRNLFVLLAMHQPSVVIITETRITNHEADDIIRPVPFLGRYIVESIDCTGGIWLLYTDYKIKVRDVYQTDMIINALLKAYAAELDDSD